MSALYDKARNRFLTGDLDWLNDTVRAFLVDLADYSPDLAADEFLSDVPAAARVGGAAGGTGRTDGVALTGKTAVVGVADADNLTFSAVTGDVCEAVLLYVDDGVAESSSPLLAFIDTATGLPVTPTGDDVVMSWDDGADKIFKL